MASFSEMKRIAEEKLQSMIRPNPNKSKETASVGETKKEEEDQFDTNDKQKENLEIKPSSYGWRPVYSRVDINCDKWLMTMDESSRNKLDNPPSLAEGLSNEMEAELRYLGCELIQQGAIMLKLPQTAAATGQILFQRFYYQKSFVKYYFEAARSQRWTIYPSLLWLKVREVYCDLLRVLGFRHSFCHQADRTLTNIRETTKGLKIPMLDVTYIRAKNNMILMERRILSTLGFVVHVKHPHRLIVAYCHALGLTSSRTDVLQKAWNYMNDGLRTDIFMRYTAETIACACIFLAARTVENPIALPSVPFHWFEAFDTSDRDVQAISIQLIRLYSRKRIPNWPRINAELDKLRDALNKEKAAEKAKEVAEKFEKMAATDERKDSGVRRESPVNRDRNDRKRDREKEKDRDVKKRENVDRNGGRRRDAERGDRDVGRDRERDRRGGGDRERNRDRNERNVDRNDRNNRNDKRRDDNKDRRKRSRSRSKDRIKDKSKARERDVIQALGKRYKRESGSPPPRVRH